MDEERVSHEVGNDGGAARPGLDRLLAATCVLLVDLLEQMLLDEGSFLEAASHNLECGFLGCFLALNDEAIAGLVLAAGLETLRELAPGRHRMMASATTLGLTLTATHRVIDWVHHHTPNGRTNTE